MRYFIYVLIGAIIALIAFLPLSWIGSLVVPEALTTPATQYKGTVWRGSISKLKDLEGATYTLSPLKFITGKPPATVRLTAPGLTALADIGPRQARAASFQINAASLPIPDPRLKGLSGNVIINISDVSWNDIGECQEVNGTAQSDILLRNRGLFNWGGPMISGPIKCDAGGRYNFNLVGDDDIQKIDALISVSADGYYQTEMNVITRDSNAALALPLFGFEDRGRTASGLKFVLIEQGRWR